MGLHEILSMMGVWIFSGTTYCHKTLQTFENTQEIIEKLTLALMFSNAHHALSQSNTWLRLHYLIK